MKAAILKKFNDDLAIENISDPDCPEDGVVLEVLACGVCRSDYHGWSGHHPKVNIGDILGHEYCGVVVAAGEKAKYKNGDRLIAPFILGCGNCTSCQTGFSNTCETQMTPGFGMQGAYAEYISVPRDHNLVTLPDSISPKLAAGLGCRVTTAWHALTDRANLKIGDWIAIHGIGGVGLSAVLLAKMLGAKVIAIDIVEEKLRYAEEMGADVSIDAKQEDAVAQIIEITNGGVDVSLEAMGLSQTTNASLECLRTRGRHVHIGMPGGDGYMSINMRAIYSKQLSFFGSRGMPTWKYPTLLELIERGSVNLEPLVSRQINLTDASKELKIMSGATPPGTAAITNFTA